MDFKTLACPISLHDHKPYINPFPLHSSLNWRLNSFIPSCLRMSPVATNNRCNRFITACSCPTPSQGILEEESEILNENGQNLASVSSAEEQEEETTIKKKAVVVEPEREDFTANKSIWNQMVEILKFSGPATGLWLCGPLMSLINTVVIGQSSSIELAALGPGTALCDYMCYVFMFLSIGTSNLVTTSLARKVSY